MPTTGVSSATGRLKRADAAGFGRGSVALVRNRVEKPSPLPGILDPEAHVHCLVGRTMTRKPSFSLVLTESCVGRQIRIPEEGLRRWIEEGGCRVRQATDD